MMVKTYDNHEAADFFPLMDAGRFTELAEDIAVNGLLQPIVLCGGKILDGRNRYKACVDKGIEPRFVEFDGNPWAFVWSLNGQRRDLSQDLRAQIWVAVNAHSDEWEAEKRYIAAEADRKRSEAMQGNQNASKERAEENSGGTKCSATVSDHKEAKPDSHPSRTVSAASAGVNAGAIARAEALAAARPDLAEKVRKGEIKPAEARRQAKRDAVADKVAEIPEGLYTVIYADPPWSYNDKCDDGAIQAGGVEKHYPSMSLPELKAMSIPSAPDAVLFLWATSPLLPEALELAKAWGFSYKASFVWDKVRHNMGHYNSVRHELLLVCTKGSCTPQNVKLFDSVQSIERTAHSEKPEAFREIIETLYPAGERLELFARKRSAGWTVHGNEIP